MPERNDTQSIDSIPGICEITRHGDFVSGRGFLIELPHGATRGVHFEALRGRLRDDYPDDLEQFFFVNTDVGGPECADEIARRLARRGHGVLVVRCLLPRTFVDCNRVVGNGLRGEGMTPPVPWFVKDEVDIALLLSMYDRYQALARRCYQSVCGAGGRGLILHTYAPRSVDIDRIDDDIVLRLREAYEPGRFERWPLRPAVDIISENTAGRLLAAEISVETLEREYAAIDIAAALNATYRLHPETQGFVHSERHPGQLLCIEIRRDLLAEPFDPFREMHIAPANVARMCGPIVTALRAGAPC